TSQRARALWSWSPRSGRGVAWDAWPWTATGDPASGDLGRVGPASIMRHCPTMDARGASQGDDFDTRPDTGPGSRADTGHTAARWFLLLVLMYVGFIAAATLSVGLGTPSWSRGMDKLAGFARASTVQLETVHDMRDIATNVLLFLPLGV